MSKSAFSLKIFSICLLVLGVSLVAVPNFLLSIFALPPTPEVWIRVVGVLTFNIGIYYWYAAQCEAKKFFMASVFTRTLVLVSFTGFVVLGLVSPVLILFGVIDFVGGLWTLFALKADQREG